MSRVFRSLQKAPRTVQGSRARGRPGDPARDPVLLLKELERKASETLAAAREEASSLVERAIAEAAGIRGQAAESGLKEGYEDGYEAGLRQTQELVGQAESALDAARGAYRSMLREAEPKLIALALDTAKRVAADSIRTEPHVLLDMVRRGLDALKDEREFSLRVDPELVAVVDGARDDLGREYAARSIEVVPDDDVKDGAVIRTPHGFVDVTLESQIRNISIALAEARKRAVGDVQ